MEEDAVPVIAEPPAEDQEGAVEAQREQSPSVDLGEGNGGWDPEGASFEPAAELTPPAETHAVADADTSTPADWDPESSSSVVAADPEEAPALESVSEFHLGEPHAPPPRVSATSKKGAKKKKGKKERVAAFIPPSFGTGATASFDVSEISAETVADAPADSWAASDLAREISGDAEGAVADFSVADELNVVAEAASEEQSAPAQSHLELAADPRSESSIDEWAASELATEDGVVLDAVPADGWLDVEGSPPSDESAPSNEPIEQREEEIPATSSEEAEEEGSAEAVSALEEAPSAEEAAAVDSKTRKKKKRVGEGTLVPEQPQFSESGSELPHKKRKTKKTKGKKASADPVEGVADVVSDELSGLLEDSVAAAGAPEDSATVFESSSSSLEPLLFAEQVEGTVADLAIAESAVHEIEGSKPPRKKKKSSAKTSARVEQLQQQLEYLTVENETLKQALATPETRAEFITQDVVAELGRLRELSASQQEQIDQLLSQIEELQRGSMAASSESDSDASERLTALEAQNQKLQQMHDSAVELRENIAADKQRLQDHVAKLSAELDRLQQEREEAKSEASTLQNQCRDLVNKWNSYKESLDAEKRTATADLDTAQRERALIISEREALNRERRELREAQEALEAEQAASKTALSREKELFELSRQQLDRELASLQQQLEVFEKDKPVELAKPVLADDQPNGATVTPDPVVAELEDLRSKLALAERQIEAFDSSADEKIAELNAAINSLVAQHQKIEDGRVLELRDLQTRYDSKLSETQTLKDELDDVCARLDLMEKDNDELRQDLLKDRKKAGESLRAWTEKSLAMQQEADALAESNRNLAGQVALLESQARVSSTPAAKSSSDNEGSGWDDFGDDFTPAKTSLPVVEPSALHEEIETLKSELRGTLDLVQTYETEVAALKEELKGTVELVQRFESETTHALAKLDASEESNSLLQVEVDSLRAMLKNQPPAEDSSAELVVAVADLNRATERIQTLEQELEQAEAQLDRFSGDAAEQKSAADSRRDALLAEVASLRVRLEEAATVEALLRSQVADAAAQFESTSAELEDARSQVGELRGNVAAAAELESKLADAMDQIAELKTARSRPAVVETAVSTSDDGWDNGFDDFAPPPTSSASDSMLRELEEKLEEREATASAAATAHAASSAASAERLEEVERQLSAKEYEIVTLKSELETIRESRDQLSAELNDRLVQLETQEAQFEEQRAQLEAELLNLKESTPAPSAGDGETSDRIQELEQELSGVRQALDRAAPFEAQALSVQAAFDSLTQTSQEAEARFVSEVERLQEALALAPTSDNSADIADLQQKLHAKSIQLKESMDANEDYMFQISVLSKQTKTLTTQSQEQQTLIAQLEAEIQDRDSSIDAMNADLDANNARLQELQGELQSKSDSLRELSLASEKLVALEADYAACKLELQRATESLASSPGASGSEDKVSALEALNSELRQEMEELRIACRSEVEQLMTQVAHLQSSSTSLAAELQARDEDIASKSSFVADAQQRLESLEGRYKEQVIAADQFMSETSNYRKQIKKLNDFNEKLQQENSNLRQECAALQKDFDVAKQQISALDSNLQERSGASDAKATELHAIATRLKAELLSLGQQRDAELLAKDQEIERIRIEKQEEYERLSMQLDDFFRERNETGIRLEASAAEVSRATSRSMALQRELETFRNETATTLRSLQAEKDQLEDALQQAQLRVVSLEAESSTVGSELQTRVDDLAARVQSAEHERDSLEQALQSLEKTFTEEKLSLERTNADHVQQNVALQSQTEQLASRLAEESSTVNHLLQRLEQMQSHSATPVEIDSAEIENLQRQLGEKDALLQRLLQEKDELVQRLVVSTQDASSPVEKIVAAKEELEIQLFRMQEAMRIAAAENASLRERLAAETQKDLVTKLNTAIEILKREKDELTKQLNSIKSGAAENETITTLRGEKQQLAQLLFAKTMEIEELSRKSPHTSATASGPAAGLAVPTPLADAPKPNLPVGEAPIAVPTDSAAVPSDQQQAEQSGWVSGVWNVIWGTD